MASLEVLFANSDDDMFVREPKNCSARLAMSKLAVISDYLSRYVRHQAPARHFR